MPLTPGAPRFQFPDVECMHFIGQLTVDNCQSGQWIEGVALYFCSSPELSFLKKNSIVLCFGGLWFLYPVNMTQF